MGRIYPGLWRVRVIFEWNGELVHDFTEAMPYDDCAQMCLGFAIGGAWLHGLTEVHPHSAKIEPMA